MLAIFLVVAIITVWIEFAQHRLATMQALWCASCFVSIGALAVQMIRVAVFGRASLQQALRASWLATLRAYLYARLLDIEIRYPGIRAFQRHLHLHGARVTGWFGQTGVRACRQLWAFEVTRRFDNALVT